jgi:uncharacterized circularly permuted ATP-grasp superfamily protein/uncharacterized alpha-E superfamily protein
MTSPPTTLEPVAKQSFCSGYRANPTAYDEMLDETNALRAHWQMFVTLLDDLGWQETKRRWDQARRVIHENGVTYNVYGDPQGIDRPWSLDAVPLLISSPQWRQLERGLIQRAMVLNLTLADLYGPQDLLHEGLLPPELIFANPAFLRPCHGAPLPDNFWMHLYSCDLGRSNDGTVWGMGDHTQAPSGAGYALENRIVLSRALPDVFRDCRVHRLATFFRSMQKTLANLSPHNRDNPRIVVLTPGPYNETYFEHAYLARYLGYTLVEGADLTVRDHKVYLKTLGGLQTVDVILRRLDDNFCDPLELRTDSTLGVAGLVEAVHRGNVAVANPLGSGLVESPAFPAFMPQLCRRLLGEDLLLPSVNTWWCGDPISLQYVLDHLPSMVIKCAFPALGRETLFANDLSQSQTQELINKLRANPIQYAAQRRLDLSTAPVLIDNHLEPRRGVLRTHLVASGDSYSVMPGGLARFGARPDSLIVSMQKGGGSKDTWILADGPVDTFSLLHPSSKPVTLSRGGGELPSRVAENLYWLGRYIERAEGVSRLVRGILARLIDQSSSEASQNLAILSATLTAPKSSTAAADNGKAQITEADLLSTIFDASRRGSLKATLFEAHRLARIVRDRISIDTWRIVNNLDQDFLKPYQSGHTNQLSDVLGLLDKMVITLAAFGGLAMDSMTRGQAWRFLDMGRRIERAMHTIRLLQGTLVEAIPQDTALLEAVLEIADSGMTYRRRYLTTLQAHAVLDLLVCDETNPRSIAFHIVALAEHVDHLASAAASPQRTPEQQILIRCLTGLRLTDIPADSEVVDGSRVKIRELLGIIADHLSALSDTISHSYFSHATVSRQSMVQGQSAPRS